LRNSAESAPTKGVEPARSLNEARPTFRSVFDGELNFVWNTLRRFGVAERDLEDLAHEVFVVVDRQLGSYDPSRPLRPWLFTIAFRCASDYRRLARHRHETLVDNEVDRVISWQRTRSETSRGGRCSGFPRSDARCSFSTTSKRSRCTKSPRHWGSRSRPATRGFELVARS
jgi:RNA polymerase sigma factor (sigma-70 family)